MRRDPRAARISAADWFDRAPIGASLLCLLHGTALLLLLGFALPSSTQALITGHRHHEASRPIAPRGAGLVPMTIGALALGDNAGRTLLTIAGSLILASAHLVNWCKRHLYARG